MAQNVSSAALQENYEVVLFFGIGRGPIGSVAGGFYLMKDAAIVPIRHHLLAGKATHEVQIEEAA